MSCWISETNSEAIWLFACASSNLGSGSSLGYLEVTAYPERWAIFSRDESNSGNDCIARFPSSLRSCTLRKGVCKQQSKDLSAFSQACWQWNKLSFKRGGSAFKSTYAALKSSVALKSQAATSFSIAGSSGMENQTFFVNSIWKRCFWFYFF